MDAVITLKDGLLALINQQPCTEDVVLSMDWPVSLQGPRIIFFSGGMNISHGVVFSTGPFTGLDPAVHVR